MVEFPTSGPAAFYLPSPAGPAGFGIKRGKEVPGGGVLQGAAPGDAPAAKSTMAEGKQNKKTAFVFRC